MRRLDTGPRHEFVTPYGPIRVKSTTHGAAASMELRAIYCLPGKDHQKLFAVSRQEINLVPGSGGFRPRVLKHPAGAFVTERMFLLQVQLEPFQWTLPTARAGEPMQNALERAKIASFDVVLVALVFHFLGATIPFEAAWHWQRSTRRLDDKVARHLSQRDSARGAYLGRPQPHDTPRANHVSVLALHDWRRRDLFAYRTGDHTEPLVSLLPLPLLGTNVFRGAELAHYLQSRHQNILGPRRVLSFLLQTGSQLWHSHCGYVFVAHVVRKLSEEGRGREGTTPPRRIGCQCRYEVRRETPRFSTSCIEYLEYVMIPFIIKNL
eukprot:1194154-Prorocentrum_minimum.AAC.2